MNSKRKSKITCPQRGKNQISKLNLKSQKYNPSEIEQKWQDVWEKEKIYSPNLETAKKPFYNLMMFPYPSAEGMHVGNMYAFTGADVYGRFQRMQGQDVFEPIGLDGFGIHSENYAIKQNTHPAEQAKISEKNFYRQLRSIGNGFDWARTVETYKPAYYKWTQWLFIQLFKAGLAYRKKAPVNFCPSCKTVLSDEQVEQKSKIKSQKSKLSEDQRLNQRESAEEKVETETINVCERCGTEIELRNLEQWFFRITKYADRLLSGLTQIDWSEKVKTAQKLWIGRSEGARIEFKIQNLKFKIEVFTTRPDTLFGATFLVLAPEHPFVAELLQREFEAAGPPPAKLKSYIEDAKKKTERERGEEKEKTGVFTGIYAINPVNKEKIPVWVADYVLMGYGTGAIMAVPAHDKRDFEFAKKYNLEIKQVISSQNVKANGVYEGGGSIVNSGDWNGWETPKSIQKVIDWLEKKGLGKKEANYHLRDWLISRQRYWGPPIPLVFCENCARRINDKGLMIKDEFNRGEIENPGWIAVNEADLPVELPFIKDYKPLGTGKAPLASHPEFYKATCPKCGGEAKRETDVSDTFLDSAWYFLRYVSTDIETTAFDRERVKKWLPVNMYIGGAEHSVLHLLYSRFITMVLYDLGLISFEEPFTKFRAHGLIVKDGAKMSKSKGNVVVPDAYIKKFGADSLRTYLMFSGPFSQGGDFRDTGIEGMSRFLRRVWTLFLAGPVKSNPRHASQGGELLRPFRQGSHSLHAVGSPSSFATRNTMMHKTIKKVTEDISNLSYNTAIAALMEWYNFLNQQSNIRDQKLSREEIENFIKLLAPFAPHMTEELWERIMNQESGIKNWQSIHLSAWPKYEPKYLVKNEIVIVIQVNGKLRGNIKVQSSKFKTQSFVEDLARKDANVTKYLEAKKIRKVIYIPGKVLNFVVA